MSLCTAYLSLIPYIAGQIAVSFFDGGIVGFVFGCLFMTIAFWSRWVWFTEDGDLASIFDPRD